MPARRPEIDLLLCAARTSRAPTTTARVEALARDGIDWGYLLRTAQRHGVEPLLYRQLSDIGADSVPKHILEQLRSRFHANQLRNLYLSGELLKLLRELKAQNIPALPYKGPVLAAYAYGNVGLRWFGDLDVLVRDKDVPRATTLLTSLGYQAQYRMTKAQEAAFMRYERQFAFMRADGCAVEIHWTVAPWPLPLSLDEKYLWGNTTQAALGGGTVATLGPEALMITLCVHGAAHLWERLGWICDLAEVVRASSGDVNWERLLERAEVLNVKRMLLLGALLAGELLDAKFPDKVLDEARLDRAVNRLAGEVHERLFIEDGPREVAEESAGWRFHLTAMERLQDKLWYCVHRATAPNSMDWEMMPLPAVLFPCYRVLRPIRLGGRLVGGLLPSGR